MDVTQTHVAFDLEIGSPLISCRFDPAGRFVFAGAEDFRVWRMPLSDTAADSERVELITDSWVRGMTFADSGETLITGGTDGRLIWFPAGGDASQGKIEPVRAIEAHDGWIRTVATSPDGKLIASAGNDLKIRLWNAADGKQVGELSGHESHIYNLAFHPDGVHLVSGDLMANLIDWDFAAGKQVRTWKAESLVKFDKTFLAFIGGFRGMTFSPDGRQLAGSGITNVSNAFAGIGNPSVVVFDWEAGGPATIEHLSKGGLQGVAWGVALHPDGTRIAAVGGKGGYLLFWKANEAEDFHRIKLDNDARDLHLSPDGLHLATAHHDGHLRIHRMEAEAEKVKEPKPDAEKS